MSCVIINQSHGQIIYLILFFLNSLIPFLHGSISSTSCSMESSISLFSSRFVETECSYQFDLTVYPRSVMSDKRMLSAVLYVVSCI